MQELTQIVQNFITFLNDVAVPLIFAVAFIVFLFGVFRYYIAGGANPEKRKEGTQLILYSVIGFAVMISVWGLVNLVVGTFSFTDTTRPAIPTFDTTSTSGNAPTTGNTNAPVTTGNVTSSPGDSFVGPRP